MCISHGFHFFAGKHRLSKVFQFYVAKLSISYTVSIGEYRIAEFENDPAPLSLELNEPFCQFLGSI